MVKAFIKKLLRKHTDKDPEDVDISGNVKIEVKNGDGEVKDTQVHDI
jgi:hypothetical protein